MAQANLQILTYLSVSNTQKENMETNTMTIEQYYSDCDYLTGKNYDNIQYDSCNLCYRYDICSKAFENHGSQKENFAN